VSSAALSTLRVNPVAARSENQRRYLEMLEKNALVFGIGPAGTGKTYLAVAAALRALRAGQVKRIVITRPVVEAGEHLGFLPGDLQAKLNPYTRPIYDAFYDLLGFEDVLRFEEQGVIEVAPLAFMRGRTLSSAFAILDEGQNTTVPQMKMFLTRLGEHSRMVVTGDPSQTDLDARDRSGLLDAVNRLRGFQDVGVTEFVRQDIVRHSLVEQIVRAYEGPPRTPREGDRREEERETRAGRDPLERGREAREAFRDPRDSGREGQRENPRESQREPRDPHRDGGGRDHSRP
jgi:phosphate starvation-inducible PhoH-like protein